MLRITIMLILSAYYKSNFIPNQYVEGSPYFTHIKNAYVRIVSVLHCSMVSRSPHRPPRGGPQKQQAGLRSTEGAGDKTLQACLPSGADIVKEPW